MRAHVEDTFRRRLLPAIVRGRIPSRDLNYNRHIPSLVSR